MNAALTILMMFLVTYATRLAGLSLGNAKVPGFWLHFLKFIPVSVFTALVVLNFGSENRELPVRLIAALVAGGVFYFHRQLWSCILVGMVVFWGLRTLL
ncbi:AzlD domain-containing protein [Deinococcus cellulosilyticus]|uniref:AzlD domain-containing protein n=1 Tax=Deinococcus cellulosilyticus (strain DSM 18568 / NBRC 106333 / KACC 11606 / 5516J-15) TaxID=1223518 RepID=A0A511N336_DEIC1|nr:AzlD domain-containing protein [Deinococcus cellulosilyticus]GEM47263.1 hypothetical protein DC3_28980 [Deinococcus cellulosilyticus NBRC 106333 = KACC 11606]